MTSAPAKSTASQAMVSRQHRVGDFVFSSPHVARGAFSRVYKGRHLVTGQAVAVKYVKFRKCPRERIDTEIAIMRRLGAHPNVIQLLGVHEDVGRQEIFLVLEWCNSGDLATVLRRYHRSMPQQQQQQQQQGEGGIPPITTAAAAAVDSHERTVRAYMLQIRAALVHLDRHHVLHRDFKPGNILLHRDPTTQTLQLKLADFGLATYFGPDTTFSSSPSSSAANSSTVQPADMFSTMCGSPLYLSPEIVLGKGYTTQSDLWSIGIVLYELMSGVSPFPHNRTQMQHFQRLSQMRGSIELPTMPMPLSGACRQLVGALLTVDPAQRATWVEFFEHAWFQEPQAAAPKKEDEDEDEDEVAPMPEVDNEPLFQFDDEDIQITPDGPQLLDDVLQLRKDQKNRLRDVAENQSSSSSSNSVYDEFDVTITPGIPHLIDNYDTTQPLSIPIPSASRSPSCSSGTIVTHASFRSPVGSPNSPHSFSFSSLYHMRVPRVMNAIKEKLASSFAI